MLINFNSNQCFNNNVYHFELPCIFYAKIRYRKNLGDLQNITLPLLDMQRQQQRELTSDDRQRITDTGEVHATSDKPPSSNNCRATSSTGSSN